MSAFFLSQLVLNLRKLCLSFDLVSFFSKLFSLSGGFDNGVESTSFVAHTLYIDEGSQAAQAHSKRAGDRAIYQDGGCTFYRNT